VTAALETFTQAVASLRAAGNLVDELSSTVPLADMWLAAGRPSRARRLYQRALELAKAHGDGVARAIAELHVGVSEIDLEIDDIESAKRELQRAADLGELSSMGEGRYRWFLAMGRVADAEGDPLEAITLLDQAQQLYLPGLFPGVRPIPAVKARVRLLIAQYRLDHDAGTLDQVAGLLERLADAAERSGRAGSLLEIRMLQALEHHAQGHRTQALQSLEHAWAGAPEPDGYVRLFLDEGAPMVELLRAAEQLGDAGGHARRLLRYHAARADEAAESPQRPALSVAPPSAESLSERELQVLRLLGSELSGPEIARELFVSNNTLRTHTKHIFTKLDVTNRRAAVRRAREEGLI
jgi:LuxR family maltose regulon positive regulatory protein